MLVNYRYALIFLACVFGLSSCRPATNSPAGNPDAAQRYDIKGVVKSVDAAKKRVTLAHEEIPNYMDAMTMPFAVRDEEMLAALAPGDTVTGALAVENNVSWLEIRAITKTPEPIPGASPAPSQAQAGDAVPDIELINQDGQKRKLSQMRGKNLALTFIYTRCPLPDYCILMSENFGQMSKEIARRPELRQKTRLLSVSLDPEFDKPSVLKTYGQAYMSRFTKTDFGLWEFATGKDEEIRKLAGFFGLTYMKENNQIVHSLRAAFIDADGKIRQVFEGNEWKPEEAVKLLEQMAGVARQN
jgi:protein SCO1/2